MSLTYAQAQFLHREICPVILDAVCSRVISISPRSFVIAFEKKQFTHYLLFSFQEPFLRFHLCLSPIESKGVNPFVQQLVEKLVGKKIIACDLLNEDRILSLSFQGKEDYQLVAEILPKRPNCYLLDSSLQIVKSFNPVEASVYALPVKPKSVHFEKNHEVTLNTLTSQEVACFYDKLETQYFFDQQKKTVSSDLEKEITKSYKRLEDRLRILNSCRDWKKVNHEGVLLQANLFRMTKGMKEVVVADWEQEGKERVISLDPLISPQNQIIAYFRRSKKLHAGERHAERLLKETEVALSRLLEKKSALDKVLDREGLLEYFKAYGPVVKSLQKVSVSKKKAPTKPYHIYKSQAGLEIWVGKSAKDNDKLTFHCAKGLDWWLHARDYPGSHVVVRCLRGQELDGESLNDAAELALRFSKAKSNGEGEVCLTQVKGVTRVKGVPGKVTLSKHKNLRIVLDNKRWERLKGIS